MYDGLKRVPGTGVKGGAVGIGNRNQGDLCHLRVGNPQELRRFFFAVEMKDGPTRAETTRTGGKHEVPRSGHNGASHGMLQRQWESLQTRCDAGNDEDGNLGKVIDKIRNGGRVWLFRNDTE